MFIIKLIKKINLIIYNNIYNLSYILYLYTNLRTEFIVKPYVLCE